MALIGGAIPSEVGLRLLLCPLGSNVVIRTACCTVGIGLPVYSTFKAIESRDHSEQEKWLVYWAAYGSFSLAEIFLDKFLYWFPFYYHMKFSFLAWLQLPMTNGSRKIYRRHLRPFLLRHQARLDQLLNATSNEIAKFVMTHQNEIQFVKSVIGKSISPGHDCPPSGFLLRVAKMIPYQCMSVSNWSELQIMSLKPQKKETYRKGHYGIMQYEEK